MNKKITIAGTVSILGNAVTTEVLFKGKGEGDQRHFLKSTRKSWIKDFAALLEGAEKGIV